MRTYRRYILLFLTLQINSVFNAQLKQGKGFVKNSDVFGTRNFIENKGQFVNPVGKDKILFIYDHLGEKISFTAKGLIYELVTPITMKKRENEEEEDEEEEQKERMKAESPKTYYVTMNWVNASPDVEITSSEKQSHYFTYGPKDLNSSTFKKITYKNIYPNIDVEYIIPADKKHGIKYNVLLHPGANIQDVKMKYDGAVKKIRILESGDLVVKTRLEDITEHAPVSFYTDKTPVASGFVVDKEVVSFTVAAGTDLSRGLVIDPWITVITTIANNNYGYDVDYDINGNTFIYGGNVPGTARCKEAMYSPSGVLIWTFSGVITTPAWNSGSTWTANFKVHKPTGKSYVARNQGVPNIVRLDNNGNYDNFIGAAVGNIQEVWNLEINCNGDIIIYGGANFSGEIMNSVTGAINLLTGFSPSVVGCCQDIVSNAIDDAGNIFVYYNGHTLRPNHIAQIAPTFVNTIWDAPSGFGVFVYLQSKSLYVGANAGNAVAFNALAVNANFLYYYDGSNLAAYNKTNGSLVGSIVVPGLTGRQQGGIAVDDCNSIYIGGNGSVLTYSFNGSTFSPGPPIPLGGAPPEYVYDIKLDRGTKVLYVTGSGFVGTYAATNSSICTSNFCDCMLPLVTLNTSSVICPNVGASTVNVVGVPGPYTYTWMPTGQTGSVATGLTPGTYTVSIKSLSCNATYTGVTTFTAGTTYSAIVNSTSITCANLGSATVIPTGLLPPYSYTWMPSAQTGSTASGLSPGSYTLTIQSIGCNLVYTTSTFFNPLIPLTGNFSNSNSVTCNGAATGTGNVTGLAGGSGNEFYSWTNGVLTYTTAFTNSISAGIWSVSVTDALTSCKIYQSFFVSQPPPLSLQLSSNTPTNCVGTNIVLTGLNSGGTPFSTGPAYTYTWTGGPVADSYTVSENTSGTYTYTVSSSDANDCLTNTVISVNFVANPTLSVSDVSICPFETGTLTANGATTYTWNATFVGNNYSASPAVTQQYSVVGAALSCTASTTASIIIKPLPVPLIQTNSPKCNGDELTFTGFSGTSFVWFGPAGFSSATQGNTISPVGLSNAGAYQVTVTAANSCTASTSATVVVHPTPTLSTAGSTVCTTQTLNLSVVSFPGASYLWTGPLNYTSVSQNPFVANPTTSRSGTYTVRVTSAQGCTNTATAEASVVLPPAQYMTLSSGSICAEGFNGSPNSFTLTSSGANSYTLSAPLHLSNSNPSGPSSTLTSLAPFIPGVITLTLEGSNDICTSIATRDFTIKPNPVIAVNPALPVICANQNFTFTNSGATNYFWGSNTVGLTISNQGQLAIASPTLSTVYSVYGSSLGCNSDTKNANVTVNALPVFTLTPGTPTVCLNEKISLIASGNAEIYSWDPFTGLNNIVGSTVVANPTIQQTYTVVGSLNNCTTSAMITLSVLPLPVPVISVLKEKICLNESVTLQGSGGEVFNWYGPLGEIHPTFDGGRTVSFKATVPGFDGTYTLVVADKNGCKALATASVGVYRLPSANMTSLFTNTCVPFRGDFSLYSSSGSVSDIDATWHLDESIFKGKDFTYLFTKPGEHLITGFFMDRVTNCINTATFAVTAYPQPIADFEYNPEHPVETIQEVVFRNTSIGDEQKKWNWSFINNEGFKSDKETCTYTFKDAGIYPVVLMVTNVWGCKDTVIKTITVDEDFNMFVPNVFTPNGDGHNDIFIPVMRGVKFYDIMIFDRWGEMIFRTVDPQQGWDGHYKGQMCQNGVYSWKINVSTKSGNMKQLNGHVTINR